MLLPHLSWQFDDVCSFCGRELGSPSQKDRASLLSSLLTVPALLDACALYCAAGGPQLDQLVSAAFVMQPRLANDLTRAATTIADNIGQVVEACQGAVGGAAAGDAGLLRSLRDGAAYLRDTCLTLCAFLRARPAAAPLLLSSGPGLVEAMGAVHDQLLPAVQSALGARPAAAPLLALCRQVELASERLTHLLLLHSCVDAQAGNGAGASGAAGGSSSSGSSKGGAGSPVAVARGEALLRAVMALGHREEESSSGGGAGSLALGHALAERFGLGGSIEAALHQGLLWLDEAQLDYLAALLGLGSLAAAPSSVPGGADGGIASHAGRQANSVGGSCGGVGAVVDVALLLSQIQQVQDLLPDYGAGFVAACLEALGDSPEQVLDALLEGSLPPEVAGMDPQLSLAAYQQHQAARQAAAAGKGKRPVGEPAPEPPGPSGLSATAAAWPAAGGGNGGGSTSGGRSSLAPGFAAAGGGGRRQEPRIESKTAKYLDLREEGYRTNLLASATAMQASARGGQVLRQLAQANCLSTGLGFWVGLHRQFLAVAWHAWQAVAGIHGGGGSEDLCWCPPSCPLHPQLSHEPAWFCSLSCPTV